MAINIKPKPAIISSVKNKLTKEENFILQDVRQSKTVSKGDMRKLAVMYQIKLSKGEHIIREIIIIITNPY